METALPIMKIIIDESDRYGKKYKKDIKKINKYNCFICIEKNAGYSMDCSVCNYTYRCCLEHKDDLNIIVGWDACMFCKRKLMDNIMKKFGKPHSLLKDDVYGFNQIVDYLKSSK